MDQHLQFKIGTTFSGEGFTKLKGAVTDVNRTVKTSTAAISQISSSIGAMDGAAARSIGAITGLVNSFMTLNPVMLAITAATTAISWGLKELKDREEAAQKKADDLRKSMEGLVTKLNDKIFEKAITDANGLGKEFERITKHANDLKSAMDALASEQAKGGALDLQVMKLQAVVDEITDEGKKLVAAEWDVQIAIKKESDVRAEYSSQVAKAHQAVIDEENRIVNLQQQRATMEEQLQRLESNNHALKVAEKSVRERLLKQIEDMKNKMAAVDDKIIDSKNKLQVLQVNEQTATVKMTNALTSASMEVAKAEDAQKRLIQSIDDAKDAERRRAESVAHDLLQEEELKAQEDAARKEVADAKMKEAQLAKELSAESAKVKEAERNLADAIERYRNNLWQFNTNNIFNEIAGAVGSSMRNTFSQLLAKSGDIAAAARDNAIQQGIGNGNIRTVDQANKVGNDAARQARQQLMNKMTQQEIREKERADRLEKKSEKAMSKADKEWLKRYKEIEKAKKEAAEAIKRREQELKEAKAAEKKKAQDIAEIRKKLDVLGLK